MSEHFCDTCNRVRLTSTGDLHTCLGHDDATDLRTLLRGGGSDAWMAAEDITGAPRALPADPGCLDTD